MNRTATMWCLNTNVRPGDVVLLRSSSKMGSFIAAVARGRTTNRFSHAALCVGAGMLVEAMPHGVSRLSASRVILQDLRNVAVLRLCTGLPEFDVGVALRAAKLAVSQEARCYAFARAALSVVGGGKPTPTEGVFCSHLIASCFRQAGQPLADCPDHRVTPNRLHDSPCLTNVSLETLSAIQFDGPAAQLPSIDSSASNRPIADFSRRLVRLVRAANKIFVASDFAPVTDFTTLLQRLAENADDRRMCAVDEELTKRLQNAKLDDFIHQFFRLISDEEEDIQERTHRLISKKLLSVLEARRELPMFSHHVAHKRQVYSEYCEMRDALQLGYKTTNLAFFQQLYSFYHGLCLAYVTHGAPYEAALTELAVYAAIEA